MYHVSLSYNGQLTASFICGRIFAEILASQKIKGDFFVMKIITNKAYYMATLKIAIPIALQNLITLSTSMMDTLMLGKADSTGNFLSASSLANQPFFILTLICFGLSGASSVLSSQYYGKHDMGAVKKIYALVLRAAIFFGILMGTAVLMFPYQVMRIYSSNPDIIDAGVKYLRIIGFAYFIFAPGNTLLCSLRSVEIVKISVVVNLVSFVMNVFLNWVLIFGNLGAPALGIEGAAIATLTARISEFVITFVYVLAVDKKLKFRLRDIFAKCGFLTGDLLRHGTPVFIIELAWSLGMSVQAGILGHITYSAGDPVAANSISSIVQQVSTIFLFGVANASAVMVGKSIGEGNSGFVKKQAFTLNILAVFIGFAACGIILLIKRPMLNFYDFPPETIGLAGELINVMAFISIFVSFAAINIMGVLRGSGDTSFCLITETICIWAVALPASFVASRLKWPVPVVLALMKSDEILKVIICMFRYRNDKWIHSLTRQVND